MQFHVNDLISSHQDKKNNDDFVKWLNKMYDIYRKVTETKGKVHAYLGMKLELKLNGDMLVDMAQYVDDVLIKFPIKFEGKSAKGFLANNEMLNMDGSKGLNRSQREIFDKFGAMVIFNSKEQDRIFSQWL